MIVDIDLLHCALFVTRVRAGAILGLVERARNAPLALKAFCVSEVTLIFLDRVRNFCVIVVLYVIDFFNILGTDAKQLRGKLT